MTPSPLTLDPTPNELISALRDLVSAGLLDLPLPGHGRTHQRLHTLARLAAEHLALARLAEAHLDAVTILNEAGMTPASHAVYGVWGSHNRAARLRITNRTGQRVLSGSKAFRTGAGLLDRALVAAHDDDNRVSLVDIDLHTCDMRIDASSWSTAAFAATRTATITIDHLLVAEDVRPAGTWTASGSGTAHSLPPHAGPAVRSDSSNTACNRSPRTPTLTSSLTWACSHQPVGPQRAPRRRSDRG